MRVIVAGSRSIRDYSLVWRALYDSGFEGEITEIVSGTAQGVDRVGESWAQRHQIPVHRFPADWSRFGRRAGFLRNRQMAEYADALVLVWDGQSRGSALMLRLAREHGLRCFVSVVH